MDQNTAGTSRNRPPTMRDVARRAGVDPSVVSRLLSNDPRLSISAATRERVNQAVRELNYRPNLAARALRTSRHQLVAVLLPDLANPVYAQLMHGIQSRAIAAGYGLVIAASQQVLDRDGDTSALLDRVDGLVVAAGTFDRTETHRLAELPVPTVVINRQVRGVSGNVLVDDVAGTCLVAEHLLALGHRHFAVLLDSEPDGVGAARLSTFSEVVEGRGNSVVALRAGRFGAAAGHEAVSKFFARVRAGDAQPVTAFYAVNFLLGLGVLRAAADHGIAVPGDVSVASLHESDLAAFTQPSLTTVQMPMFEAGATAFDQLLAAMTSGRRQRKKLVSTEPILLERESTGPAPV